MDVLIINDKVILNYERGPNDVTPKPKYGSIISEEHWKLLIGNPETDKDGNPIETFEERQTRYILNNGWTISE